MRILILVPGYAPKAHPRAFRWEALAKYWAGNGHEIHVISSRTRESDDFEFNNSLYVHRVGYSSLKDLIKFLWKKWSWFPKTSRSDPDNSMASKPDRLEKILHKLNKLLWHSIYWPDGACLWYFPARKKAKDLLKTQRFDVLISVSLPFTAHLVGRTCKSAFPYINWIVDIGDPFSFLVEAPKNNHRLYKKINFAAERSILNGANAISVTVEATRQKYISNFKQIEEKIKVIPPLYNNTGYSFLEEGYEFEKGYTHLAYFGNFYYGIRTPLEFLKLLETIQNLYPNFFEKLKIHFFGDIAGELFDPFLQSPKLLNNIICHGVKPKSEVLHLMGKVDVLLNISNKTSYQLPSKSVDYLMAGKPIINICYTSNDAFKLFFDQYPAILNLDVVARDRIDLAKEFMNFYNETKNIKIPQVTIAELGKSYSLKAIASAYEKLFI